MVCDSIVIEGLNRQLDRYNRNRVEPHLQQLFLELTQKCNLSCVHCGSRCDLHQDNDCLTLEDYKRVIDRVYKEYGNKVFIALTGGEPLLYKDLIPFVKYIHSLGFTWGMTTNGTLFTDDIVVELINYGLWSVSISLDGVEEIHASIRGVKGCYQKALKGISLLEGKLHNLMITSVFNHKTLGCIDEVFEIVKQLDVDTWRVVNIEPIGSAANRNDLLFTKDDFNFLYQYIYQKRSQGWPVTFGCSHYLGYEYEGKLRDWYWFCNAGLHVLSVMSNGDIGSCLDIERRKETIFGNIKTDDIIDVWKNKFQIYRNGLYTLNKECSECKEKTYCRGDSAHTWDYDVNRPKLCYKNFV